MTTKWIGDAYSTYTLGQIGFLVERNNVLRRGSETAELRPHPARTNMGNEPKLRGWCGTSNDVAVYAQGVARVTRLAKNGRALVKILSGDDLAAALEELGYPELT